MPIPPLIDYAADLADRLASAIHILSRACARIALEGGHPTLSQERAGLLFFRASPLVILLMRVCNFGARAPATRKPKPQPEQSTPEQSTPEQPAPEQSQPEPQPQPARLARPSLPRRPGWLLDALPELAPDVAAELRTLLHEADVSAVLALFDAAPFLLRRLRPLLRSLAIDLPDLEPYAPKPEPPGAGPKPASAPSASPKPAPILTPNPAPPTPTTAKKPPEAATLHHALFVTISN